MPIAPGRQDDWLAADDHIHLMRLLTYRAPGAASQATTLLRWILGAD